jgi:phosphoribosylamine-glycine ligase
MLTQNGPKVLEYNVRFGDPETEALMLLLSDDTDLAEVFLVREYQANSLRWSGLTLFRHAQTVVWMPSQSRRNLVLPYLLF